MKHNAEAPAQFGQDGVERPSQRVARMVLAAALEVLKAHAPPDDIDAWAEFMNRLCADSSTTDEETMRRAIEEHRRQAKAQVRREMGLPA